MARVYADVNEHKPKSYWDYENYSITFSDQNDYQLVKRIGRGKYSEVFEGINIVANTACVVKVLKPVKPSKIQREIKILETLRGVINVVQLETVVRDDVTKIPSLVFEHIACTSWLELQNSLTDLEVRHYMYQILLSLDACHSMGIMHRDVKPHNIIVNHSQRMLRLIDWGLAEFYHKNQRYNVRVASRHYKGPELLIGYELYDYSLDLWSFGCVLASVCFRIEPLFHGSDNSDQLIKIAMQLGTDELKAYVKFCQLDQLVLRNIPVPCPSKRGLRGNLEAATAIANKRERVSPEVADLVDSLLCYNHAARLTAAEAMLHKYFDPVRPKNNVPSGQQPLIDQQ